MSVPYTYRLNVLTSETTIWLGDDGLQLMEKGGKTTTYAYSQITKVALSYEPSRATADLYLCRVFVAGRSTPIATVSSTFYRGFLSFDPQLPAYKAFVRDLHRKLVSHRGISFRAGVSNLAYWGNAVFISVVVFFSAFLLIPIAESITLTGMHWLKIALIAFLLPLAAMWFWSNRPRPYDPSAIPAELLPDKDPA